MKKIFFLLTMLASVAASAQNMQITPISATYTTSPVIKFKVGWTGARTYRHNTKVWVFVDYRKIENNAPAGIWTRAAVSATPAVSSSPASTATLVSGNDKGFWLNGVDGDYSATITVSLTLVAGVTQFNWCAYATDYPPNVVPQGNNSYTLRGSRPFIINGSTLTASQTTYSGTIISFTDATGAPGRFPAALNERPNEMGCVAGLVENANGVCAEPSTIGCINNTLNLGTVSFTTGTEVTIVGNGISQIWSRPVTATGCQKTTFNSGTTDAINADCRTNPNYAGDFFSSCAAFRYHAQLCPPPWRMPAVTDARNLANALGCDVNGYNETCVKKIMYSWDSEYSGVCAADNHIERQEFSCEVRVNKYYGMYGSNGQLYSTTIRLTNDLYAWDGGSRYWWWNMHAVLMANALDLIRCVRDN
jgi:hypothetical protein